ncbi:MAG: hypothetical protein MCM46_05640 [Candidatus Manganitrophus sp. SB1]|nr:hypothetical protein [Candidatus Manganitrophus morganii]
MGSTLLLTHVLPRMISKDIRGNSFFILLSVLCVAVFLQGCVALSFGQSSYPFIDEIESTKLNTNGVLELPDLTISVRPQNAGVTTAVMGYLVPILPLPGTKTRPTEDFRIYLQFESLHNEVFSLNPDQVRIFVDGSKSEITPTKYLTLPDDPYPPSYATFARNPSYVSPGHNWRCNDALLTEGKMTLVTPSGPMHFHQRICFVLEYPTTTPTPEQEFTLTIGGLRQENNEVEVPPIHFRRKVRIKYELIPNPP